MTKRKKKVAKSKAATKRKPVKKKVGKQKVTIKSQEKSDKVYSFKNRSKFVDLILGLRIDKKKGTFTYRGIADQLTKKGYRNRVGYALTPQFIGNILNRWTEDGVSLIGK